jgi:hypothetical protein
MILIITKDLDLAKVLVGVPGEKEVLVKQPMKGTDQEETDDRKRAAARAAMSVMEREAFDAQSYLRHWIYCKQPSVLLLDVRFGGQLYRVIENVPRILGEADCNPRVILLIPFDSKVAEAEAARLGCFDVVNFHPRRRRAFLSEVVSAVEAALLDRAAGGSQVPPASEAVH